MALLRKLQPCEGATVYVVSCLPWSCPSCELGSLYYRYLC